MTDPVGQFALENGNDPQHPLNPAEHNKQYGNDVCRDFLKQVCRRGKRCKFLHPDELEQPDEPFNFCIDFQNSKFFFPNRGCVRQNCRFIHAPEELVAEYKNSREVTLPLARCIVAVSTGDTIAGIPLCGEFQDGICTRTDCRYWHINAKEERARRAGAHLPDYIINHAYEIGVKRPIGPLENPPYSKMPRMHDYEMPVHPNRVMDLERSNAELRKEVDMLRYQLNNERERYQDLYALFRQLAGPGTIRLQTPQSTAAAPLTSFPHLVGYKPPGPPPEWQSQRSAAW